MRYDSLTYEEIRDLASRTGAVFVPLGCTEQQGPHLPVDFDAWMITRLCDDIAGRFEREHGRTVLVMPALPFGPTPEHAGFGFGFVNLRQSTHEAVVEDVLESLAAQGFSLLAIWRGCGQHDLGGVTQRFNRSHPGATACQPVIDYGAVAAASLGPDVPGGHADSFATSIRLHLDPEAVRRDRIRVPHLKPFEWGREMDFAAISDTGVIGDPTQASAEAGAKIWESCVREGVAITQALVEGNVGHVRQSWHFLSPE